MIKSPMSDSERIDFLQGEMQALLAFCFSMIQTHHDLPKLIASLNQSLEQAVALATPEPVGESAQNGLHDMKRRLIDFAEGLEAKRVGG